MNVCSCLLHLSYCCLTKLSSQFAKRITSTQTSSQECLMTNCCIPEGFSPLPLSGPVNSDVMPNGNGLAEGFGTAGDTLPPTVPPQSTSSPINSQNQEPSPGVAAYPPMMLEKSEGASAEVTVHKGDALQSLRLSMPMQETDLCKHKFVCSECPLYDPLYSNLLLMWSVLVFSSCTSVCFNSPVCVLSERKDSVGISFNCLTLPSLAPIAVSCLTIIWCGCFWVLFEFMALFWY